jgi:hypothetical protein
LKPRQTVNQIAASPGRDGVAIAVEFRGDLEIGGPIVVSSSKDQATAEGQGLGRGTGPDQALEFGTLGVRQRDGLGKGKGHW